MPNKLTNKGRIRGRPPKNSEGVSLPRPREKRHPDLSTLDIIIAHEAKRLGQLQQWFHKGFDIDGSLRAGYKKHSPLAEWLAKNLAPQVGETVEEYERREKRVRQRLQRVWTYLGW